VVLALADRLDSHCARNGRIELVFKIASSEYQGWSGQEQTTAKSRSWADETGNLTCYRNAPPPSDGRLGLTVLVGVDRVTDASSLADFHQCGPEVVWKDMRASFGEWVTNALRAAGLGDDANAKLLGRFDDALRPLIGQGRADLLQIADLLEGVNFAQAERGEDAFIILMRSLRPLGLPVFRVPSRRRTDWGSYYERAAQFFSYSLYLDERERAKAGRAIESFREALADGTAPIDNVGAEEAYRPYASWDDYLNGIQRYVEKEDGAERARLLDCDFIFLADKVLKFKKPSEKPEKETVRRLDGGPVEVVLHGLWMTFADFSATDEEFKEVERIEIEAVEFRHDYEDSDEGMGDDPVEREEHAREYLQRLTGGVDNLVERHVTLMWSRQATEKPVEIACRLCGEGVSYRYAGQGEPLLTFAVSLIGRALGKPFVRKYAWRLPETHSYRLAEGLIRWADDALRRCTDTWSLPVFHVPYYEELIRAKDDEETRRVLLHCIRDAFDPEKRVTSLLTREWLESDDALVSSLKRLADCYVHFLGDARANGMYAALETSWTALRQAFLAACEAFTAGLAQDTEMLLAPALMRVFLVVQRRGIAEGNQWVAEPQERSGVATVLHPAVLEMLQAQSRFLFSCFNAAVVRELQRKGAHRLFAAGVWNGFVDLATIRSPLETLLCDGNQSLDTNLRGADLIHRIGLPENENATLSTRLLLRYEGFEDEEIADAELFRDTRESRLLHRLMVDYFRLHPHARDGLSLAVYRNADIQPVIAAVHCFLQTLADRRHENLFVLHEGRRKPYAMSVTIFSDAGDDVGVGRWIEQWRERWEVAESESKFEPYRYCRFSVAHRIVPEQDRFAAFKRLIQDSLEADIAVLYDFIGAGQVGNRFERVEPYDVRTRTLQFPILEKACCAVRNPARRFQRTRLLSNRQFRLCSMHT
jgi:DNA phosphorothioation-dependent restriction protein DptH